MQRRFLNFVSLFFPNIFISSSFSDLTSFFLHLTGHSGIILLILRHFQIYEPFSKYYRPHDASFLNYIQVVNIDS